MAVTEDLYIDNVIDGSHSLRAAEEPKLDVYDVLFDGARARKWKLSGINETGKKNRSQVLWSRRGLPTSRRKMSV